MKKDQYQERYKNHQSRKRDQLIEILNSRVSQRIFNGEPITENEIKAILINMAKVPNSCSRQAVYAKIIEQRDEKELLGAFLVGGVGWIHRAEKILLLFAAKEAYKAGDEVLFMPYLDAGAVLMTSYLICESMNIGVCFVNPNIRKRNLEFFNKNFNDKDDIFCGALAIGKYDKKVSKNAKKTNILIK